MFIQVTDTNIDEVLLGLWGHKVIFDTETTAKDILKAKIVHVQFGALDQDDVYWATSNYISKIFGFLVARCPMLIAHHAVYDVKGVYWDSFEPDQTFLEAFCAKIFDTKIGLKLIDENADADLDTWVQAHYQDDYKAQFWANNKSYHGASLEEQIPYACKDIVYTRLLYAYIQSHSETVPTLLDHVQEFNRRLLVTSVGGLILDRDYLLSLGTELQENIIKGKSDLLASAQHDTDIMCMEAWCKLADAVKTPKAKANRKKPEFNWSSPSQIMALLYGRLKLPVQLGQKTKSPTVDDEALEKLADLHPIASKLRDYRTNTKMYTSFVEGVIEKSRKVGSVYVVHPEFNPVGTVTLRTNCTGPNYQQLPADKVWGKLRGMLIPKPGYRLITCDYQSLEVYLAAAISLDPTLLKVCRTGASFHDATVEGLKEYGITRAQAKTLNFAILYGGTEHRVSAITKTSLPTSKKILEAFWTTYPGIKTTVDECHRLVDSGLPIETAYGNKRRTPEDAGTDQHALSRVKRQAYNFKIQSTGAGLTSRSFVNVDKKLRELGIGFALFVMHDELIVSAKEGHEAEVASITKELMELEAKKLKLEVDLIAVPSHALVRWEK